MYEDRIAELLASICFGTPVQRSIQPPSEPSFKPGDRTTIHDLPTEILWNILSQMQGNDPSRTDFVFTQVPAALCLVSRRWNSTFVKFLYAHFHFNGDPTKVRKLWSFLKTIYYNPELASRVRGLVMTTTEYGEVVFGNKASLVKSLRANTWKNEPWFTHAYEDSGLHHQTEWSVKEAILPRADRWRSAAHIWEKYMAPLTATILAHCPNMKKAHLHVDKYDHNMAQLLRIVMKWKAVKERRNPRNTRLPARKIAFKNCTSLALAPSRLQWSDLSHSFLPLGPRFPFDQLPGLKELTMLDIKPDYKAKGSIQEWSTLRIKNKGGKEPYRRFFFCWEAYCDLEPRVELRAPPLDRRDTGAAAPDHNYSRVIRSQLNLPVRPASAAFTAR